MKENFRPNIEERPVMIILGIVIFYFLIEFFAVYLLFLHRINLLVFVLVTMIFTLIYLPRFLIIKKLKKQDEIKIIGEYLMINGIGIPLAEILDFNVEKKKPVVVFFMSNKMVVFNCAIFYIKLRKETLSFRVIGSEKTQLLEEFFKSYVKKTTNL